MKVQLLYLDAHDDHVSVRDKLGWVKAPRLLIVWPRHGRVLTRRLDLKLVQRQAERRGSQLGLVSFDPDVRDHAAELGIPVFDSADALPESLWPRPLPALEKRLADRRRLEPPRERLGRLGVPGPRNRRLRWAVFGLGTAAVAAMAVALIPSATIVLTPTTRSQQVSFQLQLDPAIETAAPGRLPAVRRTVAVAGHLRLPTTGTVLVPTSAATGTVTFTNLGQLAVTLPSGTGLLAGSPTGARFVTTQPVQLAAGEGSHASVGVKAANPGLAGNVGPGAIYAIEGPLGLQVSVTNPESTVGGGERRKPAVSAADLAKLESQLRGDLMTQAAGELSAGLGSDEGWDPATLVNERILQADYDAQLGEVADTVSLTMRLEASGWVYSNADLENAAASQLQSLRPAGASAVPGSLQTSLSPVEETAGQVRVSARQSIFDPPSAVVLAQLAAGQSPAVAAARISSQVHPLNLRLILRPAWLSRLPWLPVRIELRYAWEGG